MPAEGNSSKKRPVPKREEEGIGRGFSNGSHDDDDDDQELSPVASTAAVAATFSASLGLTASMGGGRMANDLRIPSSVHMKMYPSQGAFEARVYIPEDDVEHQGRHWL